MINHAALLQKLTNDHLRVAQKRYNSHRNKTVRSESIYSPGDYLLVYRLLLASTATERLAAEGFSNLMPKRNGQYRVLDVRPEHVSILQDKVKKSIGFNRKPRLAPEEGIPDQSLSGIVAT